MTQPDTTLLFQEPHQSRDHEPTSYEIELAGAIEEVFASGAHELPALIEGLRTTGLRGPDGQPWTEDSFLAEMRRLGG